MNIMSYYVWILFYFYVITVISTGTSSFHGTIADKSKPTIKATESNSDGNYYIGFSYSYNFCEKLFHCLFFMT